MHPPQFEYYRANSVADALNLLSQHSGAKVLAGGHSLIPAMNLRLANPGVLVDIGRIDDLKGIHVFDDGWVAIWALSTHAMIAASPHLPTVLSEAAGQIGDPQVRNRGTIGGNIAHADPASDLPTVLLALDARLEIVNPTGSRTVDAREFFKGLFETDLQEGEILHSVLIPPQAAGVGSAYAKLPNPASRYCMVGAAVTVTVSNGACTAAGVAVGGLTPIATKAPSVEAALVGKALDADTIAAAAEAVQNDLGEDVLGDIHASADYRRAMAPVFVKRALMKAAERAQ